MDILLSLPIVSYFAAPALTSWSTSLNLLFFYMTWSTLVLSHKPLYIELVGTLAVRVVFWLLPSLLFLLFDAGVPSLAESIKLYGTASLPRRNGPALIRQLGLAVFNLLFCTAVQAGLSTALTFLLNGPVFKTSTSLPLPYQIIKHILALYTAREILTYYLHRNILHGSKGPLARLHNEYAHTRRGGAPCGIMLYSDHPLPLLLHRLLPAYLPALLIRPHLLTYFVFTLLTTIEDTAALSGYSIVPGIILGGITRRTGSHYASGGRGNYGTWGLLDWFNGTSVGKDLIEDVQDEAEKHHVGERAHGTAEDIGGFVRDGLDGLRGDGGKKGGRKRK